MKVGDLVTRDKANILHGRLFGTIYDKTKSVMRWGDGAIMYKYKICWIGAETVTDDWWPERFLEVVCK